MMTEQEAIERFREGLKKAVSKAKELGRETGDRNWFTIALQLRKILENGDHFITHKALTRSQVLAGINGYNDNQIAKQESGTRH